MTRPYAIFPDWHWPLTWMLVAGFLAAGVVMGAAAGLLTAWLGDVRDSGQVELAANMTLVLAFLAHLCLESPSLTGWSGLFVTAATFAILLAAAMRSRAWRGRAGWLTNPWIISGLLLGVGQEFVLLDAAAAASSVRFWGVLLAVGLILAAVVAAVAGRVIRPAAILPFRAASYAVAPAALIGIIAATQWLTASAPPAVHASPASSTGSPSGPNVLLIVMDTVRADHLSVDGYGRPTSPHLQELARDSVVYTQAVSASNFTLTSHASLFTGMYPSWHGAYCQPPEAAYGRRLDDNVPTLAEILSRQNYSTLGVAANLYLRAEFGLQRGFQQFEIPRPVPVLAVEDWYLLRRPVRRILSYEWDTAQFDRLYSRAEDVDHGLFSQIEGRSRPGAPFFAFVNYMDAHFPYVPPAPFDASFPGKNPRLTQDDLDSEQQNIAGGGAVPANFRPHAVSQYDGGIAYVDTQIGNVIQWLKQRGLYDNTMIVVTSDHGESFGERNYVGHANSAYQNLLHVALMVKYPKAIRKGVETEPVDLVDVAPTILNVLGIPGAEKMQGRSLLQPAGPRELFSETFPCAVLQAPECPRGCTARAVYSWPYKFITSTNGKRQLFDVRSDPGETRDLSQAMPLVARLLNADLHQWMKGMPDRSHQDVHLDRESIQRLKSLGYVQ